MQILKDVYTLNLDSVYSGLQANADGLNDLEVKARFARFGPNALPDRSARHPLYIFLAQFKSALVYILLAAAYISYWSGHTLDAYVILSLVLINTAVGFYQEFKAEKSIGKLKEMIVEFALVRRGGQSLKIPSKELVPGDIVILREGDKIPSDCRLLTIKNLEVNESLLTGESNPVTKNLEIYPLGTTLTDQKNMVFMGTTVTRGSASAIVIYTGINAALGQIAKDLQVVKTTEDHFKKKTNLLAMQMSGVAIFTTLLTFIIGYFWRGFEFAEIFVFSIASLVSGIPEGLPVVLTVVLSLSATRMARRHAIIRRLSATETLAVVDTIITDKTGTLTTNQMTATHLTLGIEPPKTIDSIPSTHPHFELINTCLWGVGGSANTDPTESAIAQIPSLWNKEHSAKYRDSVKLLEELPFEQIHRYKATLLTTKKFGTIACVMGAPESILKLSSKLKASDKSVITAHLDQLTKQALRPVSLAYVKLSSTTKSLSHKDLVDLEYLCTVGIIDPPRADVAQAIASARRAGIRTIMATGDHPNTALAIAKQIGLVSDDTKPELVLTGTQIDDMTDSQLIDNLKGTQVYARMTPSAKMRLATLMMGQGHIVAMTGDGVNDAPALKVAHIGIAMGQKGTDVAREVSDIVLADDNYATIVHAIEEGRTQFRNIRRTSYFLITTNISESLALIIFLAVGLPIPLLPKQILWLNLVTGGITDIALATEPIHEDVLNRRPHTREENILTKSVLPFLGLITIIMIGLSLLSFLYFQSRSFELARTAVFIVLSMTQLFNLLNMRSLKKSIFQLGLTTNQAINFAFISSLVLLLIVIYLPLMRPVFEFETISLIELLTLAMLSSSVLWAGELYKYYRYRNR